jgi:lipid-A-disaccharide synthase-like uncharacterized protein
MNDWFQEMWVAAKNPIVIVGFVGQAVFFMRFLVQWVVSEKQKRSVIPVIFWYFSIGGAILLLIYGILDRDPVIVVGQSIGTFVYLRNLTFIAREKKETQETRNAS